MLMRAAWADVARDTRGGRDAEAWLNREAARDAWGQDLRRCDYDDHLDGRGQDVDARRERE